jgi:hypothetical protein
VTPIILDEDNLPSNVIVLHEAVRDYAKRTCGHTQIIADAELEQVTCKQCGEKLNAVQILARFAKEQNLWWHRAQEYRKAVESYQQLDVELAEKHRCKCEHCKKMTRIDRRITTLKVVK